MSVAGIPKIIDITDQIILILFGVGLVVFKKKKEKKERNVINFPIPLRRSYYLKNIVTFYSKLKWV